MPGGNYLRSNFRIHGEVVVLGGSWGTGTLSGWAGQVSAASPPASGTLVGISADACAIYLYTGAKFVIFSCDASTGA